MEIERYRVKSAPAPQSYFSNSTKRSRGQTWSGVLQETMSLKVNRTRNLFNPVVLSQSPLHRRRQPLGAQWPRRSLPG